MSTTHARERSVVALLALVALLTGCSPESGVKDHSWWVYVGFFVCVTALMSGAAATIRVNIALPFLVGLLLVPLSCFLFGYFALGQWDRFRFFFMSFLLSLGFIGGAFQPAHHEHETKSGAPDRRFKDNPEVREPDDDPTFNLGMGIGGAGSALSCLAMAVWVFFRAVPDISKLFAVATLEHLW
jgi:hypothetical protein